MCGRYTLTTPGPELIETFEASGPNFEWSGRYNIAPGQQAPVVAEDRHGRRVGLLTWGLVPAWMDEPRSGIVNARAESLMTKRSFREAFHRRRCLVPATGFFEWWREGDARTPWWFHPAGGETLAFAGLWERWSRGDVEPRHTFTIITTQASPEVARVHERMPLLLQGPDRDAWLDRASSPRRLAAILHAPPAVSLEGHAVSRRVNRVDADDRSLLEPLDAAPT
jgi:putative SOS response-associated peptidase YedK